MVRSTDLEYDALPHLAKLVRVTQRSYAQQPDGDYLSAAMPPIEMAYTQAALQPVLHEIDGRSLANLPDGVDGVAYRMIDLDGEGLPGIAAQLGENLVPLLLPVR